MSSSTTSRPPYAGTLFGIDLADLFDDEGEVKEGFEGFEPSFTVEQQYQGRSPSTMTYKTPFVPPTTTIFSLTPKATTTTGEGGTTGGGSTATQPQQPVQEAAPVMMAAPKLPELDRELRSFIGLGGYGDPNKDIIGAAGIGAARQYGYSNEDIMQKAAQENIKFGADAATTLGLGDTTSYVGDLGQSGFIGDEAVQRMRAQGLADSAIKELAKQQGQQFGPKAAQSLGYTPNVASPQGYSGYQTYTGSDAGSYANPTYASASPGSVGAAAIDRMAAAQGISQQQAAQQAVAQGYSLGDAARAYL